ncbi:hypothetical protein F5X99DRAFT_432202 [Biscogniauxia marginata]|nr:hypothetical protein F5X99DRAFT_432202 [Biscogniauxia marginata]
MSAAKEDYQLSALAAGFTLGFGFLTVWEAVKQTHRNRNPLRSVYIYRIFNSVPLLFFILVFWPTNDPTSEWGTAIIITIINIAVFCIFIPSHLVPPVNNTYVRINEIWDRMSKFLICIVDGGLNWYFLRGVKQRLLKQHGLMKYKPLVSFTARLMVVSILMDLLLIGLMWLPNQVVFIQFHPVTYMVKLNIEMTMSSLITKLAKRGMGDEVLDPHTESFSHDKSRDYNKNTRTGHDNAPCQRGGTVLSTFTVNAKGGCVLLGDDDFDHRRAQGHTGIQRTVDIRIEEESIISDTEKTQDDLERGGRRSPRRDVEDELSLTRNMGHPRPLDPTYVPAS